MGEITNIEWTDHTFNPWIGCTKVSAACDHCYAETLVQRYGWASPSFLSAMGFRRYLTKRGDLPAPPRS